jgi:DNA-binding response OmpR family regulator
MARILIIDDEPPIRQLLRKVLEHAGHTVLDASDGRMGMALWRREPVDVVVTDIFMPEKDGVEVLMELKGSAVKPKIIAISGGGSRGMPELKPTVLCLGADRILMKPFEPRTLLSSVQEVLNDHA